MSEKSIKEHCDEHTEKCYKTNIKPIMQEIRNLGEKLNNFKLEITKEIAELPSKIIKETDDKYANKNTERVVYGMITLILIGVVGAWVNLVVIQNKSSIDEHMVSEIVGEAIRAYDKEIFETN